jgi:LAO/AO transport system kinase
MTVSAVTGAGIDVAWGAMTELAEWRQAAGVWDARRAAQARDWFEEEVQAALLAELAADPATRAALADLGAAVERGEAAPRAAARAVMAARRSG